MITVNDWKPITKSSILDVVAVLDPPLALLLNSVSKNKQILANQVTPIPLWNQARSKIMNIGNCFPTFLDLSFRFWLQGLQMTKLGRLFPKFPKFPFATFSFFNILYFNCISFKNLYRLHEKIYEIWLVERSTILAVFVRFLIFVLFD